MADDHHTMPTHAMILAAGRGERFRPFTDTKPKPLVPVHGKPLLDYQLDLVEDAGVRHAVVNTSYLAEQIAEHLAARHESVQVRISHEPERLETGGGITHALPLLGGAPFFALNSDVILHYTVPTMHPLRQLASHWQPMQMDALLLLVPTQRSIGFDGVGDFFLHDEDQACSHLRRRGDAHAAPYVFTGAQILHPRLFEAVRSQPISAFSMNRLYDQQRLEDGSLPRIYGMVYAGDWLHVGTPEGLAEADQFMQQHSDKVVVNTTSSALARP